MITVIEGLPNILAKAVLGGDTYYKVVKVSKIDNIKQYLWSLRNTAWEKKVKSYLTSSSFLEGVSGTPLIFTVTDFWRGDIAPVDMKGTWIHKSLLFPFIIMSSTGGLFYMVEKFNTFLNENYKLKDEVTKLAMEITKKNSYITDLENTIAGLKHCNTPVQLELPMPKEIKTLKVISLNKSRRYPLRIINKAMKIAKVKFGTSGPYGKEAKREFIYNELILEYLIYIGIVIKTDEYRYVLGKGTNEIVSNRYAYTYIPHRQDNKKGNIKTNLPVQYVGLTRNGVRTIIANMVQAKIIEQIDVNYR